MIINLDQCSFLFFSFVEKNSKILVIFFQFTPQKIQSFFLVYMVQKFTRKETWLWINHKIEENKTEEGLFQIVAAVFTVNSKE